MKRYAPRQELPSCEEIVSGLARVLIVAQSFSDLPEAMEAVRNRAGAEIKAVIEVAVELDDAVGTKVSLRDTSVYIVLPGTIFPEETMDNKFGGVRLRGRGTIKTVAGTMEIGLLQRSGDIKKVLRKPRVILEQHYQQTWRRAFLLIISPYFTLFSIICDYIT